MDLLLPQDFYFLFDIKSTLPYSSYRLSLAVYVHHSFIQPFIHSFIELPKHAFVLCSLAILAKTSRAMALQEPRNDAKLLPLAENLTNSRNSPISDGTDDAEHRKRFMTALDTLINNPEDEPGDAKGLLDYL
ncbi:hypothetical protein JDV02_001662 [Purpureocillium takamizusanense]|uniref:Uncharacterized protein n=1 Tax=Purpureocillium takamizusanense TaxID=2060973 RepID=A0A9Q8V6V6_9HYPO|nr:uncharacterized protein JDV02_001662 [Purpureocillium takamizusanense]UNI15093.1 hypothetical protein JDV02_001662 [Purpureocillium takamizusanense]